MKNLSNVDLALIDCVNPEKALAVIDHCSKMFNFGKVKLFTGSETMLRDFVPVEQVVKTHLDFLKVKESGVWNVGTGTTKSFLDVAKTVAPESSFEFVPMPEILKDSYQYYTCADMSKTIKTLS